MDFRNYRVKSPIKSFRDLEVYQKTIQLSDEITNISFLKDSAFDKDKEEIKALTEKIPKLIAEAYGDKFDSRELAHKKLTEAITLMTNIVTKIDLLRQRFSEDRRPAPALLSSKNLPKLSDNKPSGLARNSTSSLAAVLRADVSSADINRTAEVAGAGADAVSPEIRRESKEILDNLLTRYQTQKVKVLNLRKAWDRVFTDYKQNDTGKTNWRK